MSKLLPDRHKQQDFFVADIFDRLPFKNDMASMEHPIFSLSTKPDMRLLEYKNGNVTVQIKPSYEGLPTVFDKDILLYCGSLLMSAINKGDIPPQTLRVSSHDLLASTNRPTNDDGYRRLKQALDRLVGTTIKTNIKTNRIEQTSAFGLLNHYDIIESSRVKNRMVRLEIGLPDWFYNSYVGKEVLTINRDYFRLRKPLERRLYEVARKHCGNQQSWTIGLESLQLKTGSTSPSYKFRYFIRQIEQNNLLPDYQIALDGQTDIVTFSQKAQAQEELPLFNRKQLNDIKGETVERARRIVAEAGTGWDFKAVLDQFADHLEKKGNPKSINGAFIGFVKKKAAQRP